MPVLLALGHLVEKRARFLRRFLAPGRIAQDEEADSGAEQEMDSGGFSRGGHREAELARRCFFCASAFSGCRELCLISYSLISAATISDTGSAKRMESPRAGGEGLANTAASLEN
ncbi:MAG: hypothetical protein WDN28_06145 [Chthoniobacter sp.]